MVSGDNLLWRLDRERPFLCDGARSDDRMSHGSFNWAIRLVLKGKGSAVDLLRACKTLQEHIADLGPSDTAALLSLAAHDNATLCRAALSTAQLLLMRGHYPEPASCLAIFDVLRRHGGKEAEARVAFETIALLANSAPHAEALTEKGLSSVLLATMRAHVGSELVATPFLRAAISMCTLPPLDDSLSAAGLLAVVLAIMRACSSLKVAAACCTALGTLFFGNPKAKGLGVDAESWSILIHLLNSPSEEHALLVSAMLCVKEIARNPAIAHALLSAGCAAALVGAVLRGKSGGDVHCPVSEAFTAMLYLLAAAHAEHEPMIVVDGLWPALLFVADPKSAFSDASRVPALLTIAALGRFPSAVAAGLDAGALSLLAARLKDADSSADMMGKSANAVAGLLGSDAAVASFLDLGGLAALTNAFGPIRAEDKHVEAVCQALFCLAAFPFGLAALLTRGAEVVDFVCACAADRDFNAAPAKSIHSLQLLSKMLAADGSLCDRIDASHVEDILFAMCTCTSGVAVTVQACDVVYLLLTQPQMALQLNKAGVLEAVNAGLDRYRHSEPAAVRSLLGVLVLVGQHNRAAHLHGQPLINGDPDGDIMHVLVDLPSSSKRREAGMDWQLLMALVTMLDQPFGAGQWWVRAVDAVCTVTSAHIADFAFASEAVCALERLERTARARTFGPVPCMDGVSLSATPFANSIGLLVSVLQVHGGSNAQLCTLAAHTLREYCRRTPLGGRTDGARVAAKHIDALLAIAGAEGVDRVSRRDVYESLALVLAAVPDAGASTQVACEALLGQLKAAFASYNAAETLELLRATGTYAEAANSAPPPPSPIASPSRPDGTFLCMLPVAAFRLSTQWMRQRSSDFPRLFKLVCTAARSSLVRWEQLVSSDRDDCLVGIVRNSFEVAALSTGVLGVARKAAELVACGHSMRPFVEAGAIDVLVTSTRALWATLQSAKKSSPGDGALPPVPVAAGSSEHAGATGSMNPDASASAQAASHCATAASDSFDTAIGAVIELSKSAETRLLLLRAGAIDVLVQPLRWWSTGWNMDTYSERVTEAIRNLCASPDCRRPLAAAGACDAVATLTSRLSRRQLFAEHEPDDEIGLRFCAWPLVGALFGFACERDNCAALQATGAAGAAAQLIRRCCAEPTERGSGAVWLVDEGKSCIVWAACGVLLRLVQAAAAELSGGSERISSAMRGDGAGTALVAALETHSSDRRVVAAASAALEVAVSALRLPEFAAELKELGAAEALRSCIAGLGLAGAPAKPEAATAAAGRHAALARCKRLLDMLSI